MPVGITGDAEVVLQPFGCFLVNRQSRRYDVLNRAATAVLLRHAVPQSLETFSSWLDSTKVGAAAGMKTRELLIARGYLGTPCPVPQVSMLPPSGAIRATRAEVEVTNRCNLRCVYCYAEANRSKLELSASQWIEILSGMHRNGLRAVLFSGGEPFLHPGFMELLDWSQSRLVIEINSNGRYITPAMAKSLSTMPIKSVQISLDSPTPDHHDSMRGRGSHAYALSAISNLVRAGVPTVASAVVTAANRAQVPALRSLVHSMGASFKGDPVTRSGYAKEIDYQTWSNDFAASRKDRVSENSESGFEPVCQSQIGYVAVSHVGSLKPCNMREAFFEPTGDLLVLAANDRWWERPYGESRVSLASRGALSVTLNRPGSNDGHYVCELQKAIIGGRRATQRASAAG